MSYCRILLYVVFNIILKFLGIHIQGDSGIWEQINKQHWNRSTHNRQYIFLTFCKTDHIHTGHHSLKSLPTAITASNWCQYWLQVMTKWVLGIFALVYTTTVLIAVTSLWGWCFASFITTPRHICNEWPIQFNLGSGVQKAKNDIVMNASGIDFCFVCNRLGRQITGRVSRIWQSVNVSVL